MVKKAISQMKAGKASGPSRIVGLIQTAGDIGDSMIHDLTAAIIRDGSRVLLFASTWERGTHWKGATTAVSS